MPARPFWRQGLRPRHAPHPRLGVVGAGRALANCRTSAWCQVVRVEPKIRGFPLRHDLTVYVVYRNQHLKLSGYLWLLLAGLFDDHQAVYGPRHTTPDTYRVSLAV